MARSLIEIRARLAEWKPAAFGTKELYEDCQTLLAHVDHLHEASKEWAAREVEDGHCDCCDNKSSSYRVCQACMDGSDLTLNEEA